MKARHSTGEITKHKIHIGDARSVIGAIPERSVHLAVTSPPYWNLKEYPPREGQLGNQDDLHIFLGELHKVWKGCFQALVPGGRLCIVVGDVCLIRKPGDYRHPTPEQRKKSKLHKDEFFQYFRQVWDLPGASTKRHPAPFPEELAYRLIRMFSFVGDTILDPFAGTGTTSLAAARAGRSSAGIEIDP
ncbi:MAG: site-specific DNA-methyltransferase [Candidatus Rokubacteria bacterium]|nr:site-specific DNA-methyltransferase [Candidatus Rokubacteria bacterium]